MNTHDIIEVYAPNLPQRKDRLASLEKQFSHKAEFRLHVMTPVSHANPRMSLWHTFVQAVETEYHRKSDYFVFCEDDHVFTSEYSWPALCNRIAEAEALGADILSGGISWGKHALQVNPHLFWIDTFNGMQFTVVFKRAYEVIIEEAKRAENVTTDFKLSELFEKIFVIYPFISRQEEFGYSDLSIRNSQKGYVCGLFESSATSFSVLQKVNKHYSDNKICAQEVSDSYLDEIQIPTYVINLPERTDRYKSVTAEFAGRKEFDMHIFQAQKSERGADGLWQSIKDIVALAVEHDDDVIVICEDDHIFTTHYEKRKFLRDVISAAQGGCHLLLGGVGNLRNVVPVSGHCWWIDWFWCTQFMVVFRPAFAKILNAKFGPKDVADEFLSHLVANKMVLWPFISEQKDFGYSDITESNNINGRINEHFANARGIFERYVNFIDSSCPKLKNVDVL